MRMRMRMQEEPMVMLIQNMYLVCSSHQAWDDALPSPQLRGTRTEYLSTVEDKTFFRPPRNVRTRR